MASGADGTIKVKLGLDDSEYKSGLSGAHKSAESFADKVKSTFVGATVFKAASKGWDLISGSIGKATARLDAMQKAKQVIGVLAGSSKKAAKVVNELSDAVSDTAYGLDTASSSTQKLATSGLGLDKSTRMVKDMMDAVSFYGDGTNETLANTVDAIAKMNASGKISADQWQRLTDAGIPVLKIFAEKTGKSMGEVSDAFSTGKISAQEFNDVLMDALENGTESFPAVAGKAKEMAGSFATSFSNMSARIAIGIANIITAFNDFLADNSLPTIQEMIANFGSVIKNGLNWIAEEIPKALNALKDFFAPTAEAIKAATEKIQEAWNSVRETIAQKLDSNDSLDFVKSGLERIRDILPILVEKVGEFVAAFIEKLPDIIDKVQTVADKIQELMPLIAAVAGAFAAWEGIKAVSNIAKTIGDAGKKIKTFGHLVSQGSGLIDGLAYAASSGTGVIASMAEAFTLAGGGLSGLSAALGVIGEPYHTGGRSYRSISSGFRISLEYQRQLQRILDQSMERHKGNYRPSHRWNRKLLYSNNSRGVPKFRGSSTEPGYTSSSILYDYHSKRRTNACDEHSNVFRINDTLLDRIRRRIHSRKVRRVGFKTCTIRDARHSAVYIESSGLV